MNASKYLAAKRLNELENSLNKINENIANLETALMHAKSIQAHTAACIAAARLAVSAMPDA